MKSLHTLRSNVAWFLDEVVRMLSAPFGALGGLLDAIRGWRYSRNSMWLWLNFPVFLLVLGIYVTLAFSLIERIDAKVQRYAVASEKALSTRTLERESFSKFSFIGGVDPQQNRGSFGDNELNEFSKRYANLLARRIISIEPDNALAHYRMALLKSVENKPEEARAAMQELAAGKYAPFPQSNAWMASELVQDKERGVNINPQDLGEHLRIASDWNDIPVRLLQVYAQLLEQNHRTPNAISVAKAAAARIPEMNLELARLYERTKSEDGLREAAYRVEEVFGARLNSSQERDVDRLAIAEVRLLTGQHNQAIAILQEGIAASGRTRPQLTRGLSSLYTSLFEKSVKTDSNGKVSADMSLIELAAEADPNNPRISEQITKLLRQGVSPNKKVLAILRTQIEAGVTTSEAHSLLAEGFYAKGNEAEAIKNWNIALTKNPNDVLACNNLALCLAKKGESELPQALELIERAFSNSPDNAEILDSYGEILYIAKRPKEAINKLEKALKIDPARLGTRKKLIDAYQAAGMNEMVKAQKQLLQEFSLKQP